MNRRSTYIALQRFGALYIDEIKRDLRAKQLISTGELVNSFRFTIDEDGDSLILTVSGAEHGQAVSDGTKSSPKGVSRPSSAQPFNTANPNTMLERIAKWMKTKGMQPLARQERGRFRKHTESAYRKAAFAVARSILRKGIIKRFGFKGSMTYEQSLATIHRKYPTLIVEAVKEDLNEIIRAKFNING